MPLLNDRQYRALSFATPAQEEKKNKFDSDCYVEGYAAKYERYILFHDGNGKPVYEEFVPGLVHAVIDVILKHLQEEYARIMKLVWAN